jgi:hypothetical protein
MLGTRGFPSARAVEIPGYRPDLHTPQRLQHIIKLKVKCLDTFEDYQVEVLFRLNKSLESV